MLDSAETIRENYSLTAEEAAAALAATVVRTQMAAAMDGGFGRVERSVEGADRWIVRLLFAGAPLALGVYLMIQTSWLQLGLILVGLSVVVFLAVAGFQRMQGRVERAIDDATDPMIARSGARPLKKAIETGRARVPHGRVSAELTGEVLRVQGGGQAITCSDVGAAWLAEAGPHLVVGCAAPDARSDVSDYVVLPAHGTVASGIRGGASGPRVGQ